MNRTRSVDPIATQLWLARHQQGKQGHLIVRTGSMAPLLRPGDIIAVGPRPNRLWPGDLVVFSSDGPLTCHRIMLPCGPGRYWQKGDLNRTWRRLAAADIIGAPEHVLIGSRRCRMQGLRFRLWNTALWLLVVGRDLARIGCRLIPRLAWTSDRTFARAIEVVIARIRRGEDKPCRS